MAATVIKVENLTHYYPDKKALDAVSFSIEAGAITALVGPNGAGKSTLLRQLAGLDRPFSGEIEIAGINVLERPRTAHQHIGYLSDDFGLYDELSVRDVLTFIGGCHNLTGAALTQRLAWVVDTMHLGNVLPQKCGTLSRGWRQRVGIGMAILHQPQVLLLDEPASGLDPEARSELSSIMRTLRGMGITSLVSSHILAELEEYCTAMLVLREGRIQQHVTLESHRETRQANVTIRFARPLTPEQETTIPEISQMVLDASRFSGCMMVDNDPLSRHDTLKTLLARGIPVCGFAVEEESLQSLYLNIAETQRGPA